VSGVALSCRFTGGSDDLFMTFILERYCRRRPRFEDWGWSSDRIVGASTDAYKPKNAERVGHLAKLMEEVEADRVIKDIASALPYDNPERVFQTMIAWGRYAGLMDINTKTRMVFVPDDEEEITAGDAKA
jgi:hypothetical protein